MVTSLYSNKNYLPLPDDLFPPDDPTLFETFNAQIKHQYAPLTYTLKNYLDYGEDGTIYRDEDYNPFDEDFTGYEEHKRFLIENSANPEHFAKLKNQIDTSNKAREILGRASITKQIVAGIFDPINLVALPFGGPSIGFLRSATRVGLGVGAITAGQEAMRAPFDPTNQKYEVPANIGLGLASGFVLGGAASFLKYTPKERVKIETAKKQLERDAKNFAIEKTTLTREEFNQRVPRTQRQFGKLSTENLTKELNKIDKQRTQKQNILETKNVEVEKIRNFVESPALKDSKLKKLHKELDGLNITERKLLKQFQDIVVKYRAFSVRLSNWKDSNGVFQIAKIQKDLANTDFDFKGSTLKQDVKTYKTIKTKLDKKNEEAFKLFSKQEQDVLNTKQKAEQDLSLTDNQYFELKLENDLRYMEDIDGGLVPIKQDENVWTKSPFNRLVFTPLKTLVNSNAPNKVKMFGLDLAQDGGFITNLNKEGVSLGQSVYMRQFPYKGEVADVYMKLQDLWAKDGEKNLTRFLTYNVTDGMNKMTRMGKQTKAKDVSFSDWALNVNEQRMNKVKSDSDFQNQAMQLLDNFYDKWEKRLRESGLIGDDVFYKGKKIDLESRLDQYKTTRDSLLKEQKSKGLTDKQLQYLNDLNDDIIPDLQTRIKNIDDSLAQPKVMPPNEEVFQPRFWNKNRIMKDRAKFERILTEWYSSNKGRNIVEANKDGSYTTKRLQDSEIQTKVKAITDTIIGQDDIIAPENAFYGMGKSKHFRHRTVEIPNNFQSSSGKLFDFIETNPLATMAAYVARTGPAYEFNLKFGGKTYKDIVAEIKDASVNAKVSREEMNSYVKDFTHLYDRVVGSVLKNPDRLNQRIARVLRTAAQLNYLGSAGIAAISEPAKIIFENGYKNTFKGLMTGVDAAIKGQTAGRQAREIILSGEALDIILGTTHMRLVDDVTINPLASGAWERAGNATRNAFYTLNGLAPITNALKQWSGITSQHTIIDTALKLANKTATASERTYLSVYGIDGVDARKIKQLVDEKTIEVSDRGLYFANTEAWKNDSLIQKFRSAHASNVMNTIMMGTPADKPILVDGVVHLKMKYARFFPGLKEDARVKGYARLENAFLGLPFQFYSYSLASVNKVQNAFSSGQGKNRAMAAATAMGLAYYGNYLRTNVFGGGYVWDKLETNDKMMRSFDYSGIMPLYSGLYYEAMHTSLGVGGPDISGGLLKPKYNVDDRGLENVIGLSGAGPSYFFDFANNSFELAFDKELDYSEGAYQFIEGDRGNALKGLMRQLPFARIPWWKQYVYDISNSIDRNVD